MKKLLSFLFLFSILRSAAQVDKLSPGKWIPGFTSITRYDSSRPAVAEQADKSKGRILQINLWYPSMGGTRKTHFADYVELVGKELDGSKAAHPLQKGTDKYFEWPASAGADKKAFTQFLEKRSPMQAYRDAKWQNKRYPLIMLVHGFAADYAYLGEYLASFGFAVMHVPVKGTLKYELDYEGKGLESQVNDYEFAWQLVKKEFPFIAQETAAVGFSFGGQSAVALAIRHPHIKAVVSLDGGIGSFFGAQLVSNQSYYAEKKVTSPILHLYNAADPHTELSWFKSIPYAERFLGSMKNMQHGHFTSFGLLNKILPGIMGKEVANPGNGYEAVMFLTREFIRETFDRELSAASFFSQREKEHPWLRDCLLSKTSKAPGTS